MNLCPKTIHVVGSQKGKGGGWGLIPHSRSFSREYCVPNFHHRHPDWSFSFPIPHSYPNLGESRLPGSSQIPYPVKGFPNPALYFVQIPELGNTFPDPVLQWYGHPRVLGIPIPKTLGIWASLSFINLAIWLKVRVTGEAHITRDFGNGDAQNAGTLISQWHRCLKVLWEWFVEQWSQLTSMQKFIIQTFFDHH